MLSVKEYNIVLLGETGTGKSMFINSFASYFNFDCLNEAIESKERVNLISSKFKVTDAKYEDHVITSGENDGNERTEVGESFTINCKSYKFLSGDIPVRLIDTPGVGDTRGKEADKNNVANILNYINNFENLHAIGIVMKNSETKMTDRFNDCLKTLFANLNKSAVNNIVFILTFSPWYKPGPVKEVVERFIENELKDSTLKLDRDRMYCFENSGYEYLVATQQGVKFDEEEIESQSANWRKSTNEMKRLIKYVSGLSPHEVRDTVSLNDARQFIKIIQPFSPMILENIKENTKFIINYGKYMEVQDESVKDMQSDDDLKQFDIKIVPIDSPITFCTSPKCRQTFVIGGEEKLHYPMECCKGCRVGDVWRRWCEAMNWKGNCRVCGCNKDAHHRSFSKTERISLNLFTDEAMEKFNKANSEKEKVEMKIKALNERSDQLILEHKVIENAEKKFAKFLQVHTLKKSPERGFGGSDATQYKVNEEYEREIAEVECISIDEFYRLKNDLVNLPINGSKFKEILDANAKALASFVLTKEMVKMYCKTKFESLFQ